MPVAESQLQIVSEKMIGRKRFSVNTLRHYRSPVERDLSPTTVVTRTRSTSSRSQVSGTPSVPSKRRRILREGPSHKEIPKDTSNPESIFILTKKWRTCLLPIEMHPTVVQLFDVLKEHTAYFTTPTATKNILF